MQHLQAHNTENIQTNPKSSFLSATQTEANSWYRPQTEPETKSSDLNYSNFFSLKGHPRRFVLEPGGNWSQTAGTTVEKNSANSCLFSF